VNSCRGSFAWRPSPTCVGRAASRPRRVPLLRSGRVAEGRLTPDHHVGADAGVSFWSSHHPERSTTATVISTTIGAWPVVETIESHTWSHPSARWSNNDKSRGHPRHVDQDPINVNPRRTRGRVEPLDMSRNSVSREGTHQIKELWIPFGSLGRDVVPPRTGIVMRLAFGGRTDRGD
jgi:hypothetical protein